MVALAHNVVEVLTEPEKFTHLGAQARQTVVERYDLQTRCLPALMSLIAESY